MRRLPLGVLLALVCAFTAQAGDVILIEPHALLERLAWGDQALVVLDVRTAAEFAEGHVPGARNVPHTELTARLAELEGARDSDIVVYCRSGNRTTVALEVLRKAGFSRLFHLHGDYQRWSSEKHPVTAPQ